MTLEGFVAHILVNMEGSNADNEMQKADLALATPYAGKTFVVTQTQVVPEGGTNYVFGDDVCVTRTAVIDAMRRLGFSATLNLNVPHDEYDPKGLIEFLKPSAGRIREFSFGFGQAQGYRCAAALSIHPTVYFNVATASGPLPQQSLSNLVSTMADAVAKGHAGNAWRPITSPKRLPYRGEGFMVYRLANTTISPAYWFAKDVCLPREAVEETMAKEGFVPRPDMDAIKYSNEWGPKRSMTYTKQFDDRWVEMSFGFYMDDDYRCAMSVYAEGPTKGQPWPPQHQLPAGHGS